MADLYLMACPFCGGNALHRESHGWHGIGCNTDKCPALMHALMFRTFADAAAVWNRRAGHTVVFGSSEPLPPCTVCGKPRAQHGSYPTCATHPYTADGTCQHVRGAACVGAECRNGCVRAKRSADFDAKVRTHGYVDRVTGERTHDPDRLGNAGVDSVDGGQR
jgi:hypothetical protein